MRRVTVFAAISLIAFSLLLGAIRVLLPGTGYTIPRLSVIDPQKCPMPCWLGVRPGVTTMTEAVLLLHQSPYIDPASIQPFGPAANNISLQAEWHDPDQMLSDIHADITKQSVIIENEPGRDLVKVILVHVNVRLGDFILRFGAPTKSSIGKLPNGDLFYVLEYPALGLQYDTYLSCKRGQSVVSLYGSTFVLQPLSEYASQTGGQLNTGWHGFSPSIINNISNGYQCRG
jgi:hypothetical protein